MYPNQIPNQIPNQPNDINNTPNMGNMGGMGNMPYYPYHFISQQFQNQMAPTLPQTQVPQRSKKEPRKRASIVQVQSTPLNQQLQNQQIPNQLYQPPPPPQITTQMQDISGAMDYSMKLLSITDDKLDFFCQLFDIPMQRTRQAVITYFMTTTINRLCQNGFKLLNDFFDFLTSPQDLLIQLREPKIPRIFKPAIGIRSRYILLQFYQGAPFEFSHSALIAQNGSICVGQFVSDYLNNAPFGSVKINDRDIISVNFGEIGQYFLFGPAENLNHVTFQLNSTLIEHYYVWFVIHYLMPNQSFPSDFINERIPSSDTDDQTLVRTTVCNGCPPFSLSSAVQVAYHSGFITCPTCNQKVKFDQIKVEYNHNSNTTTNSNSNSNNSILSNGQSSSQSNSNSINNYSNLIIGGPQSGQISRFNSGNSIGIPMTPPQINSTQQIPTQSQQKKIRQKKMTTKNSTASQQQQQPQPPPPPSQQKQQPPPQMAMQMPIPIGNMAVLKNMHGINQMMQNINMNMSGLMPMNVGMRSQVPANSPMSMNKSLLSPPQANQTAIPIVQSSLNQIQGQMINAKQAAAAAGAPASSSMMQQGQNGITVTTPNQPPSSSSSTSQQQQQQQQQPVTTTPPPPSSSSSSASSANSNPNLSASQGHQQKQNKQTKPRKQRNQNLQISDENDQQKILVKQPKQKQKSAKTQSQPPAQLPQKETQNQVQAAHHSSTPQFLDKIQKVPDKVDNEEDLVPVESAEMKKAKIAMSGFLCMNLRCTRNEINWKQCVYENDSELNINDDEFKMEECKDVDDYLDFIDSFK